MDPYARRVDQEMATASGHACIWSVVRRRLLSSPEEERLIADDPLRADELAAKRVTAMCKTARQRTGNEATVFVRVRMIERARWQFSTTEIDTVDPGTFATSMLDDFECGAWD
jgi:hypothetical protein